MVAKVKQGKRLEVAVDALSCAEVLRTALEPATGGFAVFSVDWIPASSIFGACVGETSGIPCVHAEDLGQREVGRGNTECGGRFT